MKIFLFDFTWYSPSVNIIHNHSQDDYKGQQNDIKVLTLGLLNNYNEKKLPETSELHPLQ